jgi:hypothetical protein
MADKNLVLISNIIIFLVVYKKNINPSFSFK